MGRAGVEIDGLSGRGEEMSGASQIGELSVKLANAALIAREKGDDVNAIFFAVKAAETLALAKALGWKPQTEPRAPYRCGVCGTGDRTRWQRCDHPGCPDGRDGVVTRPDHVSPQGTENKEAGT